MATVFSSSSAGTAKATSHILRAASEQFAEHALKLREAMPRAVAIARVIALPLAHTEVLRGLSDTPHLPWTDVHRSEVARNRPFLALAMIASRSHQMRSEINRQMRELDAAMWMVESLTRPIPTRPDAISDIDKRVAALRIKELATRLRPHFEAFEREFPVPSGDFSNRLTHAADAYHAELRRLLPELAALTGNSLSTLASTMIPLDRSDIRLTPDYLRNLAHYGSFNERLWSRHSGQYREPTIPFGSLDAIADRSEPQDSGGPRLG